MIQYLFFLISFDKIEYVDLSNYTMKDSRLAEKEYKKVYDKIDEYHNRLIGLTTQLFIDAGTYTEFKLLMNAYLDDYLPMSHNHFCSIYGETRIMKDDLKKINLLGFIVDGSQLGYDLSKKINIVENTAHTDTKGRGYISGMMPTKYTELFIELMTQKKCIVVIDDEIYVRGNDKIKSFSAKHYSYDLWSNVIGPDDITCDNIAYNTGLSDYSDRSSFEQEMIGLDKKDWLEHISCIRVVQIEFGSETIISKDVLEVMEIINKKYGDFDIIRTDPKK